MERTVWGRHWDHWWLCTISLAFFALVKLLPQPTETLLPLYMPLLTLISFPHFVSSYVAFYGIPYYRKHHPGIAFVAPALLAAVILITALWDFPGPLNILVHITYLLLYWHYAKQIFGATIWTSFRPMAAAHPGLRESLLLFFLLYSAAHYFMNSLQQSSPMIFRLSVPALPIPSFAPELFFGLAIAALLYFIIYGIIVVRRIGQSPFSPFATILIFSYCVWLWPFASVPHTWWLFLPVFHGLQYLPFISRLINNNLSEITRRTTRYPKAHLAGVMAAAIALGYLLLQKLPDHMASQGQNPWLLLATGLSLFLNLHHFLVDAYLWRWRDPNVRQLF